MQNATPIPGELIPEVAMPFMNTVHHEELELVNGLLEKVSGAGDDDAVSETVNQWLEHTIAHFAREERLMQEYNFPPFPVHYMEHQTVLAQLQDVVEQWENTKDRNALTGYILDAWVPWLQNHIGTMDYVTAQFLSQFDIEIEL